MRATTNFDHTAKETKSAETQLMEAVQELFTVINPETMEEDFDSIMGLAATSDEIELIDKITFENYRHTVRTAQKFFNKIYLISQQK
jgi:hypothetical protein